MAVAPPLNWQSDVLQNISNSQDVRRGVVPSAIGSRSATYEPAQLSEVCRHIRTVADSRRDLDLYDLLASARREETYQPYFPGWPSLLRPLTPAMCDMPPMVQEKYRTCQTMCFCGVFPQIQHAWASIDNSLYLWRYDRSGDVPVEYCGEEQAICAVGLVRPRAGVFLEALQHIIVLCTTTEILLLGVCPIRGNAQGAPGQPGSPSLTLQPLPLYSVPSDNVIMTSVAASTITGRIFLGGSDGHLYELQYAAAESWARKRCVKVRITGKLQQLLPSFLPAMLGYGSAGAVEKVVVDDQRHTLYVLIAPGHIQVFDLGASGHEPAKKVAEVTDFYQAAAAASGGREVFRNAAGEKKSAVIKHITPISVSESSKLHLLAITADGRRVYFTTYPVRNPYYMMPSTNANIQGTNASTSQRPSMLMALFARQALPHAGVSLSRTQAELARPTALEVVVAHYSQGTLLLSEAAGNEGRTTKLLLSCRNSTVPLASTFNMGMSLHGGANQGGLRELLSELVNCVPGETCALEAVPASGSGWDLLPDSIPGSNTPGGVPGAHEELVAQLFSPPPRFVLISTAGVVQLERRRPVDVLAVMLEERDNARVVAFFEAYGAAEAAAMCLALASSPPGAHLTVVVDEALACLENSALVGEARMPQDVPQLEAGALGAVGAVGVGGMYMGQAVNPHPEPDWSAGHRGLCLYISRLLTPVWEVLLAIPSGLGPAAVLVPKLPRAATEAIMSKLQLLESLLSEYLSRRQQRGALARYSTASTVPGQFLPPKGFGSGYVGDATQDGAAQNAKRQRLAVASVLEDERTQRLSNLVGKAAQALALLHVLSDNNLGRIALALPEAARQQLKDLTLRDLVCEAAGESLATQLISVLVTQHLDASSGTAGARPVAGVEAVAQVLQRQCPAFFKEDDRLFFQASAQLKAAQTTPPGPERDNQIKGALAILKRVPAACNLDNLLSQLAYLKAYSDIPQVPLALAGTVDPVNAAESPELGQECQAARQRCKEAYRSVLAILRQLCTGSGNPGASAAIAAGVPADQAAVMSASERASGKTALLKACFQAADTYFHSCLYEALIDMDESTTLLSANPPYLQTYLAQDSGAVDALAAAAVGAELPPVGPLTPRQCTAAELLAKLFVSRQKFREAAAVYKCLAVRRSGPGTQSVPLNQRVACLQSAVLQARSYGDSAQVSQLESDLKLMSLQATVAEQVQVMRASAGADTQEASELSRCEAELVARPMDISTLYNDVAQPLRLWDVCLQCIDLSGSQVPATYVRQLWDHALMAAMESAQASGTAGAAPSDSNSGSLVQAAAVVERLGAQFYPKQHSCPLAHLVFRLAQIACNGWPATTQTPPTTASNKQGEASVARAVLAASGGSVSTALRCFEVLLARRAPDVPEQELAPLPMRLALLRCVAQLCGVANVELGSSLTTSGLAAVPSGYASGASGLASVPGTLVQREAGSLADACERFALEARRLGTPDAADLAETFTTVKRALQQRT